MKDFLINQPILDELTKKGIAIRQLFDAHRIFAVNIMASPGAGKTSVILRTIESLKNIYNIAVIEGDVVELDVERVRKLGVPVVLAHTGGSCHLDSIMMEQALNNLDLEHIDIAIVENVGNLICPANFYLGTHKNVVIASVPEGDDKPYKYPSMFKGADIVLLNKCDYLGHEAFHLEYFEKGIHQLQQNIPIMPISAKTGEGFDGWIAWMNDSYRHHMQALGVDSS